jgi:HKD family nuclease
VNELLVSWGKKAGDASPILRTLKGHLKDADQVILASAYVSVAGIELLLPSIKRILDRRGSVSIYATLDMSVYTKPDAFSTLIHMVEEHQGRLALHLYPSTNSLFHAKAFLIRKKQSWSALVGSANLTQAALTGTNFEAAVDCAPIGAEQVNRLIEKLNDLRTRGLLVEVTKANLRSILALFWLGDEELERDPKRRAARRVAAREARAKGLRPPPTVVSGMKLPAISLAGLGSRECVSQICSSGIGVGTTTELEGLSVSVQLDRFVRAGLVTRETNEKVNRIVNKSQRSGFSIGLIPGQMREAVSSAAKGVGRRIGFRSVDLGFARWVPRRHFQALSAEIASDAKVLRAGELIASNNRLLGGHLDAARTRFRAWMADVAAALVLAPPSRWSQQHLALLAADVGRKKISKATPESEVRDLITDHLVESYSQYLSEDFVRTRLKRVNFLPRAFEFPLEQALGEDADHGHKYFLACVVWAYADRVLKRSSGEGGIGEVFRYLEGRVRGRTTGQARAMADAAGRWLEPETSLDAAAQEFQGFFGDGAWTWEAR